MSTLAAVRSPEPAAHAVRSTRRRGRRRTSTVCAGLLAVCLLAAAASCLGGSYPVPWHQVGPALLGLGDPTTVYVVQELRVPRSAVAIVVGFAFGVSGAVFQSLARNPIASPDVIGIGAGASLGAVLAIAGIGSRTALVPLAALAGALLTGTVILLLAARSTFSPMRLVLVGLGMQAILSAAITLLIARLDRTELEQANRWLSGSLNALGWVHVVVVAVGVLLLAPVLLAGSQPLRVLQLGESVARSAGVATRRWQLALVLAGCALCAVAVSVAGPITLIGFLGPPIARWLCRSPGPVLLASGLTSAAVLAVADLVARFGLGSLDLPVGVLTGALGAPVLLLVLLRHRGGAGGGR